VKAAAEFKTAQVTISTCAPKPVRQAVLRDIEMRKVLVSGVSDADETDAERALEETGHLISWIPRRCHGILYGIAEYANSDGREGALIHLNSGTSPIRVLPFFDAELAHQRSGLLQVNEIDEDMTELDFRRNFLRYGNILASCLLHLPTGRRGYVLFERYYDAEEAEIHTQNCYLYDSLDPKDAINSFVETFSFVVVERLVYASVVQRIDSIRQDVLNTVGADVPYLVEKGQLFLYYSDRNLAFHAMKQLEEKYVIRFIDDGVMKMTNGLLAAGSGTRKGKCCPIVVNDLPESITRDVQWLELLEEKFGNVKTAFVIDDIDPKCRKGVIMLCTRDDAVRVLWDEPLVSCEPGVFTLTALKAGSDEVEMSPVISLTRNPRPEDSLIFK
jgi:hypothetical protein